MRTRVFIILAIFIGCLKSSGATELSERADSAYKAKDYAMAVELYNQCKVADGDSSELYFNLANSYYKLKKTGYAVLNYEKALKLNPSNSVASENLDKLQSMIQDLNELESTEKDSNVGADQDSFFSGIYNAITKNIHSDTWAVLAAVAFILFVIGVVLYVFTTKVVYRKIGFFGGIVLFCISILLIIFAIMGSNRYDEVSECIVIPYKVTLKAEPNEASENVGAALHSGTKMKILSTEEDSEVTEWLKVRLNSEHIGWIKAENVEKVEI